ncbi:MAG TPA: hypothetical protein EYG98_02455, partial [Sulfurovum sp.]|nr:hypothetical protein [Sulfurovum sp.]
MSIFKKLFELKCHRAVSKSVVSSLFYLERNTLIALILVETIFLYILMPLIGNIIAAWYGIVVILTLWRLYDAYDFQNNPNRHTNIKWHKKFVIKVWL